MPSSDIFTGLGEQCIRFANIIQARSYRSAKQDGRLACASIRSLSELYRGLPVKGRPVGGKSEGDCAPVIVIPKDSAVYVWGLVASVVNEEKLQVA